MTRLASATTMTPSDSQRLEACLLEAAEILYRNTRTEELTSFESLEKAVRTKVLEQVSPKIAFFIKQVTGTQKGRARIVKSVVGKITLTDKQAKILGLKPYSQLSPLFEKNCLLLSGNESFQDSEKDIEINRDKSLS